eukprot:2721585-Prymnesium_polylepis.1
MFDELLRGPGGVRATMLCSARFLLTRPSVRLRDYVKPRADAARSQARRQARLPACVIPCAAAL